MNELWLVALAVSTPIAGVIGFALQLRMLRKLRLENKKLHLEIAKLEAEAKKASSQIVRATQEEIEKYGDIMFSRGRDWSGVNPGPDDRPIIKSTLLSSLLFYAFITLVILFFFYLAFDIYRVVRWLWSFL